jgi:PDZ domain-containing secreted protein
VRIDRIEIRSFALPLLEAGDFVIGVNERRITSADQLERYLRSITPGSLVVLQVQRGELVEYVMMDVPRE